ncbi:MAG: hypothetical protein IB618_02865 [Candidatus Pacearchaeota archaeon]|nr:MAG: hypothetical protein IB618_02865 [Candidatus Pacearchaeota archaeon]
MPRKEKEISIVIGKNVSLVGFNKFDKTEKDSILKVMNTYIKKIEERMDYDELKIRLKQHQRNKLFVHEIKAELFINPGAVLSAKSSHKNPYRALAQVMTKLVNEIIHKEKKGPRQRPIRKKII